MSTALQVFTEVERRLAAIKTIPEAKDLRDQAEALRRYAAASKKGLAAQNHCARIKLLAERRGGELLLRVQRERGQGGGRGKRKTSLGDETKFQAALRSAGLTRPMASSWQLLAVVSLADLEAYFRRMNEAGAEIVTRDVYVELVDRERQDARASEVVTDAMRREADEQACARRGRMLELLFPPDVDVQRQLERLRHVQRVGRVRSTAEAIMLALDAWEREQGLARDGRGGR